MELIGLLDAGVSGPLGCEERCFGVHICIIGPLLVTLDRRIQWGFSVNKLALIRSVFAFQKVEVRSVDFDFSVELKPTRTHQWCFGKPE